MEGVFAIASIGRVIVTRISDEKGYEELWTYQTQDVSFLLWPLQYLFFP
jgi:hypothetical protein